MSEKRQSGCHGFQSVVERFGLREAGMRYAKVELDAWIAWFCGVLKDLM